MKKHWLFVDDWSLYRERLQAALLALDSSLRVDGVSRWEQAETALAEGAEVVVAEEKPPRPLEGVRCFQWVEVPHPEDPTQLFRYQSVERLYCRLAGSMEAPTLPRRSQLLLGISFGGGVGTTTGLCALACWLATSHSVLLVSLDGGEDPARRLGKVPLASLSELLYFQAWSEEEAEAFLAALPWTEGLHLLGGGEEWLDVESADVATLRTLGQLLAEAAPVDFLVVDVPAARLWSLASWMEQVSACLVFYDADTEEKTERGMRGLRKLGLAPEQIQLWQVERPALNRVGGAAALRPQGVVPFLPGDDAARMQRLSQADVWTKGGGDAFFTA